MTLIVIWNNKKTPQLQFYYYEVNNNNNTLATILVQVIKQNWADLTTGTGYEGEKMLLEKSALLLSLTRTHAHTFLHSLERPAWIQNHKLFVPQ